MEKRKNHIIETLPLKDRFALSLFLALPPPRGWHAKKWKNSRHVRSPAIAIRIDWQRSSMLDFYRRWQAPVEDEKVAYQRCNVPGIILGPFEAPINYVQRMKASSPLFFFFGLLCSSSSFSTFASSATLLSFFFLSRCTMHISIFSNLSLSLSLEFSNF